MSLFISKIQEVILSYQKEIEIESNKMEEENDMNENKNIFIQKEENIIDTEEDFFDDDNYDDEMINIEGFNTFDDICNV